MNRPIKSISKKLFVFGENAQFYPKKSKQSDIEIISLAITKEALQILITLANVHDTAFLRELDENNQHLKDYVILGERGYIVKETQLRLFKDLG